jgi:DNA transformation protein
MSGDDSIESLRALGPKSRRLLARIGVTAASQLRACDPFLLYAQLKAADKSVSLNMLYGLIAAIEDRDWREVARTDKTRILMRLDDLGLAPK